jgi:uncharacterized membrane protein
MGNRWGTGRLEAFSDGVFSVAATLLVFDLAIPDSAFAHPWDGIAREWPSYLAYATSFLTIGAIWLVHHALFRGLAFADRTVMVLNLLLLMAVAFLPFPTNFVASAIHDETAERAAAIFYGISLLVTSVLISAIWRYAAAHRELLEPSVTNEEIAILTKATTPTILFYLAVILLAIFAPRIAAFAYLLVAIVALLRARSPGRADDPPTATG